MTIDARFVILTFTFHLQADPVERASRKRPLTDSTETVDLASTSATDDTQFVLIKESDLNKLIAENESYKKKIGVLEDKCQKLEDRVRPSYNDLTAENNLLEMKMTLQQERQMDHSDD